jgi:hypothetical protein
MKNILPKLAASVFLLLVFHFCINLKDSVVNESEFLGHSTKPESIYAKAANASFLNPFNINTDNWSLGNIERLMLIEFKPLFAYKSVELQIIEKDGQQGALVILYFANDEEADVYYSPGLELNEEKYISILNKCVLTESEMQYNFEEIDGKLNASLQMIDRFGSKIQMEVEEEISEMKPHPLLAPIGGKAEKPEFMTIVFMKHFKFLAQSEKSISVKINGQVAKLAKLPIKVNGIKGFQTKYSMDPICISWNIKDSGVLVSIPVPEHNIYSDEGFEVELKENFGHPEIVRLTGLQKDHRLNFRFSPAIPDLQCLANNVNIDGRFTMGIDEIGGIMAGSYSISKTDQQVQIMMQATKGYSPVPGKVWMKKMIWKARLNEMDGQWILESGWEKD